MTLNHSRRLGGVSTSIVLIITLVIALLATEIAFAQTPWVDSFDSYADGSAIHGQGGWKGWDNVAAVTGTVSSAFSLSAPHSLEIDSTDDPVHEYSGHTSGQWVYTAWQYIPAGFVGRSYLILLNTYSDGGAKNWSSQVQFDSPTNLVRSDFDGNTLALVRGRWVEIRVEIDLDTDQQQFYYDGNVLVTKSWRNGVSGGGLQNIAAVDLYGNGASPVYYDNLSLLSGSSTALVSSSNPSELGINVTFTATVQSASNFIGTPSGTVTFREGATVLASQPLDGAGQASFTTNALPLGIHTITADYSGDSNFYQSSDNLNQSVVDTLPPQVVWVRTIPDCGGNLVNGQTITTHIHQMTVTFSEDVQDPPGNAGVDDVTNPANYSLTLDPTGTATPISIDNVAYNSGTLMATVSINGGTPLTDGAYRFVVNGSTSIRDLSGLPLDGNGNGIGGDDYVLNFFITTLALPATGFAPDRHTTLPPQTEKITYTRYGGLELEVPLLGVRVPVAGIPLGPQGWDVTWLGSKAGYLESTAYPSWPGNTALTGHVYLADGSAGPFVDLHTLTYGDRVILHVGGMRYIYEVRSNEQILPDDLSVLQHETFDWLTLVTCRGFSEADSTYRWRQAVRAVLVHVEVE